MNEKPVYAMKCKIVTKYNEVLCSDKTCHTVVEDSTSKYRIYLLETYILLKLYQLCDLLKLLSSMAFYEIYYYSIIQYLYLSNDV